MDAHEIIAQLKADPSLLAEIRAVILTEDLLALPQTVAALIDAVAEQRRDFNALAQMVADSMARTVSLVGDGLRTISDQVSQLSAQVDARFDAVDARFDAMDARFDAMETRQSALEVGFTALRARLDQLEAEIRAIRKRLES